MSSCKRASSLIGINLNSLYTKMHCANLLSLVEIGPVVLEKKILKFRKCIFAISKESPLGKRKGPSIEQSWIPFTQECNVLSLVEIGPVVLDRKIFKFHQCIFTILLSSPIGRCGALHLNRHESPSPKDELCQVWLKLAWWLMTTTTTTTTTTTYNGQILIGKAHLSLLLRWAKKHLQT